MNILLALIPISLVLLGFAIWAFFWAVKRGQFDDLDTPPIDILREDPHDRASREAREAARTGASAHEPAGHTSDADHAD